ncbi:MAG: hypothetical protein M3Y40_06860, partial [Chloroflexota bacterium]|nr:hypothetical protein [Chloroflexota bacterium]
MTDDRFDPELSERLRAYESRMPDAAPPVAGAPRANRELRWPIIGVGSLAVAAALLLAAVLLRPGPHDSVGEASASPVPSAAQSDSPPATTASPPIESAGPTPTPQPTPSGPPPTADLAWTQVASFGTPDMPSMVNDVVRSDGGLVAVGVAYEAVLPNVGPTPPHEGRVWLSTDGSSWQDVTPDGTFGSATLQHVLVTADSRLIAYGSVDTDELGAQRFAAWEATAGGQWDEIGTGYPDGSWPMLMAQGARGHVAVVAEPATPSMAAWFSTDGRSWERVHDLGPEGAYAVGAGDEGFVIVGSQGTAQEPVTLASGDGRSWFEGDSPPGIPAGVASRGGDWV